MLAPLFASLQSATPAATVHVNDSVADSTVRIWVSESTLVAATMAGSVCSCHDRHPVNPAVPVSNTLKLMPTEYLSVAFDPLPPVSPDRKGFAYLWPDDGVVSKK